MTKILTTHNVTWSCKDSYCRDQYKTEQPEKQLQALSSVLSYLQEKKKENIISTLLKLSRLPLKEPKTFENFDFTQLRGKQADILKTLPTLSALYAHKNLAFIGSQGVGKTHLAMAYGRECCRNGMKAYFLKATELNQKLTDARKYGRESSTINGLVKPSCLIIDEVGRCVFDKENTRMFFDIIDRRYNSNGLDLRNKYIHDSISKDETRQNYDYAILMKIMIILIIKINEEFCLRDDCIGTNSDFYGL